MADKGENKAPGDQKMSPNKVLEYFRLGEDWNMIRQIQVNSNYYFGNQWIAWNASARRIVEFPNEGGQERLTLNKIRPRVTTLLAKHTKNKIKFDVIPASKEQRDMEIAKGAHKFAQFLWQDLDMTAKTSSIFLNNLVKGWCAVKTWFDPTVGTDVSPTEGEPGYEDWKANGEKSLFTGEIRCRVCDPLTIFIDPAATTEDEIRWVVERKARDVDEIFEEYGVKVSPDANVDYLNPYDVTNISSYGIGGNETKRNERMALVYELCMKPCKKYPKGLKYTCTGTQELDIDEQAGELPYVLFGYIPIPGTIKYDAIVKDMIPVQRGINIKRSMISTHYKRLGNALWLVPSGSGVDEEELVNETGGIIYYTPMANMKPERAMAPDIPSFFDRDLANDSIDLDDMSGAREVSQGRMPSGLDTLGGLEIMVEQENEKLIVSAQNYENGMKKVIQRMLKLLKNHYTEERQGRILGEDNEVELVAFRGSDLTGHEDIKIVQGSSLPEMKAAQQERIMLMWNSGAIVKKDGTPDPNTLLRMMGMGDSTELFEQHELDENKAKLENRKFGELANDQQFMQAMQQYQQELPQYEAFVQEQQALGHTPEAIQSVGITPPKIPPIPGVIVRDFQDHEIHIYNHNVFRKSSQYDDLPPEAQAAVDAHVAEHEQMLMAPQLEQQQQQMQMQQQQAETTAQEADKNREHQRTMKQEEQQVNLQRDAMKGNVALQQAAIKQSAGIR